MLKDFRAYQLAKQFYQKCKTLKLSSHLKDQIIRASSSTALNLAEASGERTEKERERFYTIARGSFIEARAILDLEGVNDPLLGNTMDQLGAVLFKLCRIPEKQAKSASKLKPPAASETEAGPH